MKDIQGLVKFSGIDVLNTKDGDDLMRIVLNGQTYEFEEDPSDGYRSSCIERGIVKKKVKNSFDPIDVFARHRDRGVYGDDDVLELYNIKTGKLFFEVGTANIGDYYPSSVMNFNAEELNK